MMGRAMVPMLCALLLILAQSTLNKPLAEWREEEEEDGTHRGEEAEEHGTHHGEEAEEDGTHHGEEAEEVLSSLTGTMTENLKESLNLTGVLFPEKTTMKLPQYMIDLYNRYADDRTSMPVSNIIRSFNVEDVLLSSSQENLLQSHILMFNVTIPEHEAVTRAELKMKLSGVGHLSLFDVIHIEPAENLRDPDSFLASKDVAGDESVTMDVTKAVKRWIKSKVPLNKLEVFLKMKTPLGVCLKTKNFTIDSDRSHPPILIVFSDDRRESNVKEDPMDLTQLMLYEQSNNLGTFSKNTTAGEGHEPLGEGKMRARRSVERNHCTKASLIVNFKDIGWDSIILFPPSYDAGQCVGNCYYPLTDNLTPTKHAIVQSLMHMKKPKDVGNICCVPTKLESVQVVYRENRQTYIKKNYEDMKVVECGCR